MNWINDLLDEYYKFLRTKTTVQELPTNGWIEISTPFLDVFNDSIELYAKYSDKKIILNDDGKTLKNLELSGLEISRSAQRRAILDRILITYGVSLTTKNELEVEATELTYVQKQYNLLTAVSEVNDLYVLAKHNVESVFKEDVKSYFDEQEITYTPYFISRGSTGLEFTFDFQIAYRQTELLIKAFNSINKLNCS